jgi:hypothetical protein
VQLRARVFFQRVKKAGRELTRPTCLNTVNPDFVSPHKTIIPCSSYHQGVIRQGNIAFVAQSKCQDYTVCIPALWSASDSRSPCDNIRCPYVQILQLGGGLSTPTCLVVLLMSSLLNGREPSVTPGMNDRPWTPSPCHRESRDAIMKTSTCSKSHRGFLLHYQRRNLQTGAFWIRLPVKFNLKCVFKLITWLGGTSRIRNVVWMGAMESKIMSPSYQGIKSWNFQFLCYIPWEPWGFSVSQWDPCIWHVCSQSQTQRQSGTAPQSMCFDNLHHYTANPAQ